MIVTIHQPDFLPWLGFFDKLRQSDLFVVLDDVQFVRRGWHHRDRIKTPHGARWLTVPVKKKGRFTQQIRHVEIDNSNGWRHKHMSTIENAYARAPRRPEVLPLIEGIYERAHDRLIDLNMDLLRALLAVMRLDIPIVFSSEFGVRSTGNQRLIELMRNVGGDVYLTGTGALAYLREPSFRRAGIEVLWQRFDHPVYPQLHGAFEENLSAIDYLMMRPDDAPPFRSP